MRHLYQEFVFVSKEEVKTGMDFIFDFLAELFAEIFCEGILSAGAEVVPYEKLPQEKREKYKFIAVVVSVILLILLVIGGVMLLETKGKSILGKIFISFPLVYFLTAVVLYIKNHIKKLKTDN